MFDHIGFNAADFEKSKAFYLATLKPLGQGLLAEGQGWAMIGGPSGRLWIGAFGPAASPIHIAFTAENRDQVRAFYEAAIAAGRAMMEAPESVQTMRPPITRPSFMTLTATISKPFA